LLYLIIHAIDILSALRSLWIVTNCLMIFTRILNLSILLISLLIGSLCASTHQYLRLPLCLKYRLLTTTSWELC
jgi:hypothetical protein